MQTPVARLRDNLTFAWAACEKREKYCEFNGEAYTGGRGHSVDKYQLQLIGPFGLFAPSGVRIEISSKKAIALIALLATAPSGERSRRWLQAMLWGTREHEQAQTSLRREVSTLSKQLEVRGAGELLLRSSQRIGLSWTG